MGSGWIVSGFGLGTKNWYQFSSQHEGIVNFCFADGSVRGVRLDADQTSYDASSGFADSVTIDMAKVTYNQQKKINVSTQSRI